MSLVSVQPVPICYSKDRHLVVFITFFRFPCRRKDLRRPWPIRVYFTLHFISYLFCVAEKPSARQAEKMTFDFTGKCYVSRITVFDLLWSCYVLRPDFLCLPQPWSPPGKFLGTRMVSMPESTVQWKKENLRCGLVQMHSMNYTWYALETGYLNHWKRCQLAISLELNVGSLRVCPLTKRERKMAVRFRSASVSHLAKVQEEKYGLLAVNNPCPFLLQFAPHFFWWYIKTISPCWWFCLFSLPVCLTTY